VAFLIDSFVGEDGQILGSVTEGTHYGECAGDWIPHPLYASSAPRWAIQTNRLYAAAAPRCYLVGASRPQTPDYDLEGDFFCATPVGTSIRWMARMNVDIPGSATSPDVSEPITGTDTGYGVLYDADAGLWRLLKRVNGTDTSLGTWAETLVTGDTRHWRLRMRGTSIRLYVEDQLRVDATDGAITAIGRIGGLSLTTQTATTGILTESIRATNAWEADCVLSDRFEDLASANLAQHRADSGLPQHTWVKLAPFVGDFLIVGGRGEAGSGIFPPSLIYANSAPARYLASPTIPTNVDVDLVVVARGTTRSAVYATIREDGTADTAYLIGFNGTQWEVVKRVSGVNTVLGNFAATIADRMHSHANARVRGTGPVTIDVDIDGVTRISVSDNTSPLTGTKAGVYASNAATATGKCHIEQVTIRTPPAAPPDTVIWDGGFDTGDLSQYTLNSQFGHRQYFEHELPVGNVNLLLGGPTTRYQTNLVQQDFRRVSHGYACTIEARKGDNTFVPGRRKVGLRFQDPQLQGWDECDAYQGMSLYFPGPYQPSGAVNTYYSPHHRTMECAPLEPGVENLSVDLDESNNNLVLSLRAGYTDATGTQFFSALAATDTFTTQSAHGFTDGKQVTLAGLNLPAGVTSVPTYFVRDSTLTTFKLATTSGGTAINLTSDGGGQVLTTASSNYLASRDFILGTLVPDTWLDIVFFVRYSYDPGIGRIAGWFGSGGTLTQTVPMQACATSQKGRANFGEIVNYTTDDIVPPRVVHVDQMRVGLSFASVDPRT
jgi:hypothetical protein